MDNIRISDWLKSQKRGFPVGENSIDSSPLSSREKHVVIFQCAVGAVIEAGEDVREKSEQVRSFSILQ